MTSSVIKQRTIWHQKENRVRKKVPRFKSNSWAFYWRTCDKVDGSSLRHGDLLPLIIHLITHLWCSRMKTRYLGPLHTRANKSRDQHEIVRAHKKVYKERPPSHNNLQNHIVWSRALKCSVKSYVTGPSTKCYFNEYLFTHDLTHDKIRINQQRLRAFRVPTHLVPQASRKRTWTKRLRILFHQWECSKM